MRPYTTGRNHLTVVMHLFHILLVATEVVSGERLLAFIVHYFVPEDGNED